MVDIVTLKSNKSGNSPVTAESGNSYLVPKKTRMLMHTYGDSY